MGVNDCKSPGCKCCLHILKGADQFQSAATGKFHPIPEHLTCKTPSVIYIIECKKCSMQYVGKTSTTLQRRFTDHRHDIKKGKHRPIPDHFNSSGHSLDHLIVYPIEQVNGSKALSELEHKWIRKLDTVDKGLNLGPYKCVRPQELDDGDEIPVEAAGGQVEESMESPQKGKRKIFGNDDLKSKKRKKKNKRQPVFSYETEELLSKCEDAFGEANDAISRIDDKVKDISCREEQSISFLDELKKKISGLKEYKRKEKIYIGLFGKTGTGKSSLINAIVEENQLLPLGDLGACTSVLVQVQANTESSKYRADIEFISTEDWQSELHFLLELLGNENDAYDMAEDDELVQTAEEKITAIYGQEGLKKNFRELMSDRHFPEIPKTGTKTLNYDTAKELSEKIEPYIRSDKEGEQQLWPLVKRVTISLPKSPALLEGIVLVDLPGAGDVNKHRSEMWKECLSQCSSVWIVNEIAHALSDKFSNKVFDDSLRIIAGGGECYNITFICTKTDSINPKLIKRKYHVTDEDLEIESNIEGGEYKEREKQACIVFRNKILKERFSAFWKRKTKNFLLGDEGHSEDLCDVYTVSSEEFSKTEQGESPVLHRDETELPLLMEQIKKLYVSHFMKEVKDYTSDVSGIISYLHFSKDALSSKDESSNSLEFKRLEKELVQTGTKLDKDLSNVHTQLQENLKTGAKRAERNCLGNATHSVSDPEWMNHIGHHQTLKALCRNDGCHRSRNGVLVDLNYTLSEPMYKMINEKNSFQATFCPRPTRSSIQRKFATFQENFITNTLLDNNRKDNEEKYLRLVYIRTQQIKLLRSLEKEVLKKKKLIYNSLSDSIRDTMMPTYQECSKIKGKMAFTRMQDQLKSKIEQSKNTMFKQAMNKLLEEFSKLQTFLVDEIRTQMTTFMRVALNQILDDLTGLPDVSEEMKMMERCCDSLDLQVFLN